MPSTGSPVVLGVDVGGTFTDAVVAAHGSVHSAKVLSTDPQSRGVIEAAGLALSRAGLAPASVSRFVHGMTVATNALLERKGARVALVVTEGFRDLLEIGRQQRERLYTFHPARPAPLVPRDLRFPVPERVGPDGVESPLDVVAAKDAVRRLAESGAESVAVCLLWSFNAPEHERMVEALVREVAPELPVSCSVDVSPVFREYERMSTTVLDAYVTPRTRGYLTGLAEACRDSGLVEPEIMQSSGGTTGVEEAAAHAGGLLLSGPAGGCVAARALGAYLGFDRVISFDMGGTSTDCAAFDVGDPDEPLETSSERTIAGLPVRLPTVDIHTVSAGGGSIARVDAGGALKVGPASAGAMPGPACYGRGGREATVTDAHVVLGRIPGDAALAGTLTLHPGLAEDALRGLAAEAGLSVDEAAEGVVRIAGFNMAAALRAVTLERGLDPRGYALVAFGGAGGLHACGLADEVGMSTVAVPLDAGVFSALGLVLSPERVDRALTVLRPVSGLEGGGEWEEAWARLEAEVLASFRSRADVATRAFALRREVEARYVGQSYELKVALGPEDGPREVAAAFAGAHRRRYGYDDPESEVEIVTLRSVGSLPVEGKLGSPAPPVLERRADVAASVAGVRGPVPAYRIGGPAAADGRRWDDVVGPALLTAPHMSIWVAPGWAAGAAPGAVVLRRDRPGPQVREGVGGAGGRSA